MFKRNKVFFCFITIATAFITYLYLHYKVLSLKDISCTGNVNFHKDSSMLRLTSKLRLTGDKGTITLNGVLIQNDLKRNSLNRVVYFSSVKDGGRFAWTSSKIEPSIDENVSNQELKKWFPDFYLNKDGEINLYLERINFGSILISGELLPYLVCSENH